MAPQTAQRRKGMVFRLLVLGIVATLGLAACGGTGSDGDFGGSGGGSIEPIPEFEGQTFKVSDKTYTESVIQNRMVAIALEAAGAEVDYRPSLAAAQAARKALEAGEIDMYYEGMASGWVGYLGHNEPFDSPEEMFEALAKEDLEKNGIIWTTPAPFNDTYAIAVREDVGERLGVASLSDLAELTKTNPSEATICIETEFQSRADGFRGMNEAYGMTWEEDNVSLVEAGVVYTQAAEAETCNFGEIYSTDGRVKSLNLRVLEDDKHFFPIYNPSLCLREEMATEFPQIEELVEEIQAGLDEETIIELNARVDVDGEKPEDVAEDYLRSEGFIG